MAGPRQAPNPSFLDSVLLLWGCAGGKHQGRRRTPLPLGRQIDERNLAAGLEVTTVDLSLKQT
jgi:hypothetical protein